MDQQTDTHLVPALMRRQVATRMYTPPTVSSGCGTCASSSSMMDKLRSLKKCS
jgi:hypothetical protein